MDVSVAAATLIVVSLVLVVLAALVVVAAGALVVAVGVTTLTVQMCVFVVSFMQSWINSTPMGLGDWCGIIILVEQNCPNSFSVYLKL